MTVLLYYYIIYVIIFSLFDINFARFYVLEADILEILYYLQC